MDAKIKVGLAQPQEHIDVINAELNLIKRSNSLPFGNTKMLINEDGYCWLVETHYYRKKEVLHARKYKTL